ncbi:Pleckstrin -like proteiny domain-containing family O member 1 [Takifugu flavidus]|uniref:Pleckstrin-like proteiny domain-containing family O member 1 n=1 Tax=Takifugu flavidus TaxID=433684 RepID=A0A5C6PLP3_9TELE|nr:Pleckstrin -like proteiny domain-containing family O member 1 [Takifugu flavidus]
MKKNQSGRRGPQDSAPQHIQPDKVGWIRKFCGKGIFREIWKNRFVVLWREQLFICEKEMSSSPSNGPSLFISPGPSPLVIRFIGSLPLVKSQLTTQVVSSFDVETHLTWPHLLIQGSCRSPVHTFIWASQHFPGLF